MKSRFELQPAYVLHTQPFQNTSLLVDLFCLDYGRVRAIAKGARRPKSRTKALLQPFQPLLISLVGRSELKSLSAIEGSVNAFALIGARLFSALYINELLARLLLFNEGHSLLYGSYQQAVIGLQGERDVQQILRTFELELLEALGYGINLETDSDRGEAIDETSTYLFQTDGGFERVQVTTEVRASNPALFSGREIRALRNMELAEKPLASAARRLTRLALQVHLGPKPLASRELFLRPVLRSPLRATEATLSE